MRLILMAVIVLIIAIFQTPVGPLQNAVGELPVTEDGVFYFRGFEGWETGPAQPQSQHVLRRPNSGHDSGWASEVFANISTAQANTGIKSLEVSDLGNDAADDSIVDLNYTFPAQPPDYAVQIYVSKDPLFTTGAAVIRLKANYTTEPYLQISESIAFLLLTGDNSVGACPVNSACPYNTSSGAYESVGTIAYSIFYNATFYVHHDNTTDTTTWDFYWQGSRTQFDLPLYNLGDGQKGLFHGLRFQGDGASGRMSRIYVDDICVKSSLDIDCGSISYQTPQELVNPERDRIDFVNARYIQEMTNVEHRNYNSTAGWTVPYPKLLEPGCSECEDAESASQGVIYYEDGVYYYYYSMRDGNLPINAIGLATSTDGFTFTRTTANGGGILTGIVMLGNPVAGRGDSWHSYAPVNVTKIGNTYWMIYTGTNVVDGSGARYQSFLATSTNLTWWERYPSDSTVEPLFDEAPGNDCFADAGIQSVILDDGIYHALVRCKLTEPSAQRTIHYASSVNFITWTLNGTTNTNGRRFSETWLHDATTWKVDGLWYALINRGFNTTGQQDNRWFLALSHDGIHWGIADWVYLKGADMVPLGSSFTQVNSPLTTAAWVVYDYANETMRIYAQGCIGPLLSNCNEPDGMGIDIWERPIHRWRGLSLVSNYQSPGSLNGDFTTQLLNTSVRNVYLNVLNGHAVTVEIQNATGVTIRAESSRVYGNGTSVLVPGSEDDIFDNDIRFVVRIYASDSSPQSFNAQVFDISWDAIPASEQIPILPTYPVTEYFYLLMFMSVVIFGIAGAWKFKEWREGG